MIHLPRRSVTRFFIPLIDVLLLLFGIFLLMPMVAEEGARTDEAKAKTVHERLIARIKELEKLEPELVKVAALMEELDRLRKLTSAPVRERIYVRIIDVDAKGNLLYVDMTRASKEPFKIEDAKAARYLVDKHRKEAGERQLYYVFNIEDADRFTIGQRDRANRFFEGVETSLPVEK